MCIYFLISQNGAYAVIVHNIVELLKISIWRGLITFGKIWYHLRVHSVRGPFSSPWEILLCKSECSHKFAFAWFYMAQICLNAENTFEFTKFMRLDTNVYFTLRGIEPSLGVVLLDIMLLLAHMILTKQTLLLWTYIKLKDQWNHLNFMSW